MKVTRYAVVPGDTEQQAIANGREVFDRLCEGEWPIYDYYYLQYDLPCDETGVEQVSSEETSEWIWSIWNDMMDWFRDEFESEGDTYKPKTRARTQKYAIFDQHAGAVICGHRLSDLLAAEDNWVVVAGCSH